MENPTNKKNDNRNREINNLFDRLLESQQKKLPNIEDLKKRLIDKLDIEIRKLYAKRDIIQEIWVKRETLRLQKIGVFRKFIKNTFFWNVRYILSMPLIYMMVIPGIFLHIMLELYHRVCFRLYGIPRVRAGEYFIFDRRLLPYLNWFEKFNCFYCSYYNCLLAYAREIAGRTERYWCPIKHSELTKDPHDHYGEFVDYGDGEALRREWDRIRKI